VQGVIGIDGRGIDRQRNLHVGRHLARGGDGDAHGRRTVDVHVGDVRILGAREIDHVGIFQRFLAAGGQYGRGERQSGKNMIEFHSSV